MFMLFCFERLYTVLQINVLLRSRDGEKQRIITAIFRQEDKNYYHSRKERIKVSKFAKFGREML